MTDLAHALAKALSARLEVTTDNGWTPDLLADVRTLAVGCQAHPELLAQLPLKEQGLIQRYLASDVSHTDPKETQ